MLVQVGCTWGLRNRSKPHGGQQWDLECSFLIYAKDYVLPVGKLQECIESELSPLRQPGHGPAPAVTAAYMRSHMRTWQRILTMPFLPEEISPKERERLENGDNCFKVRLSALSTRTRSISMPECVACRRVQHVVWTYLRPLTNQPFQKVQLANITLSKWHKLTQAVQPYHHMM